MGFLFKSAIGLGAVYFAMYGQALHVADVAPPSDPCMQAAKASVHGDTGLGAQWAAAGCAAKLAGRTQRMTVSLAAATSLSPPAPAARPQPAPKPQGGTLTEADLQDPWFGPARIQRKGGWRG